MRSARALAVVAACAIWISCARGARAADPDVTREAGKTSFGRPDSPPPSTSFDNALRLARMLNDDSTVALLLERRALDRSASDSDVVDAASALEGLGEPDRAVHLFERHLAVSPCDVPLLERLAELQTRAGRAARATEVWKRLEECAGALTLRQAQSFAIVLERAGHPDDALHVLARARAVAGDDAHDFWDELGALAWDREDEEDALASYRALWSLKDDRPVVWQRLMTLASEAGAYEEAVATGTEAFRRSADPKALLELAELENQRQDWAGLMRTLSSSDARKAFARSGEYWSLRAEASEQLHDDAGARESYRAILEIDPASVVAKAALLNDAIERSDLTTLREYTDRWESGAIGEPALWAPFAAALERLGRTRDAIAFYARLVRSSPGDGSVLIDLAQALSRTGNHSLAFRLSRFAIGRLRDRVVAAARAEHPDADERALAEEGARVVRDASGVEPGERWFRAIARARGPRDPLSDQFAIEWCLRDERMECARSLLATPGSEARSAAWRGYRLQLAVADDDRATMSALLTHESGLEANDRIEALVSLERDDAAKAAIADALDRDPVGDQEVSQRELASIERRHAPTVAVGAGYDDIAGLDIYGPDVAATHDLGRARIVYTAAARELSVHDGSLVMRGATTEADGLVVARFEGERSMTEFGAGASYQSSTPLPRIRVLAERLFTRQLSGSLRFVVDEPIVDTSLLRLSAAQSLAELGARYDFERLAYAEVELHAREDHTRRFHHVATEIGEVGEVGLKVLHSAPEWDVGLQMLAIQRYNVGRLPSDIASLVPPPGPDGEDLSMYLPPSHRLVSIVTHLTRGDFAARYRTDREAFPRYDCTAGVGVLLPDLDGTVEFQCSASTLVSRGGGYVSALASFERGVLGIADQTNVQSRITFTQPF